MKEKTERLRNSFAKCVEKNLFKLNISKTKFSERLSISAPFFGGVVKGERNISLDNCEEIIKELKKLAKEKNIEISNNYFNV